MVVSSQVVRLYVAHVICSSGVPQRWQDQCAQRIQHVEMAKWPSNIEIVMEQLSPPNFWGASAKLRNSLARCAESGNGNVS